MSIAVSFPPEESFLYQQAYYTCLKIEMVENYCSLQLEISASRNRCLWQKEFAPAVRQMPVFTPMLRLLLCQVWALMVRLARVLHK
jgi:hypothetical protein